MKYATAVLVLAAASLAAGPARAQTIPSGSAVTIRMVDSIDSDINGVGEKFRASLDEDLKVNGKKIAKRGANAYVMVAKVEQAGKVKGREEVALQLVSVEIDGKETPLTTSYAEIEGKSKGKKTAKRSGLGAAVGAGIGGLIGGGKGAVIGAATGASAGAVYSATQGETVRIPSETRLTFSLTEDAMVP